MPQDADRLRGLVLDHFTSRADAFQLDRDSVGVEYVLNWGGFVNFSYRIRDGRHAYHLKLSASAEDQEALRRWMTLSPLLAQYHAPPVLEWIDLGPVAGPLFKHVPGHSPTLTGEVADAMLALLRRLAADRALAAALPRPTAATAGGAYHARLHRRFTADLVSIREAQPPFVDGTLLDWMAHEVELLSRSVQTSAAFDEPLTRCVHGDLWLNNVLWVSRNEWYLVDWDDVSIGDPAFDLAVLLGPTADDLRPLKMQERAHGLLAPAELARLPLLGRASLLDWVIDPLADWVEAGVAPAHLSRVRAEKERVHRQALACYRELYP